MIEANVQEPIQPEVNVPDAQNDTPAEEVPAEKTAEEQEAEVVKETHTKTVEDTVYENYKDR